jgi:arylsulfatase A-like enzyme/predicted GH43/DUF377 family glycosyl hydrolase
MNYKKMIIGAGALLSCCCMNVKAEEATKPNVLLILVDDVGYCDLGIFASRLQNVPTDKLYYETPRMDQLAKEGTMFTQFYACSVCSPTRASLMTGKMNNRMGMWDAYANNRTTFEKTGKPIPEGIHFLDNEPWDEYHYSKTDRGVSVPLAATALHDVKTIPQGLVGYHSAFIGKWHIGSKNHEGFRPEDQGFDEVPAYFDGGGSGYHRPFRAYAARTPKWDKPGPTLTPQQDYLSDDVAQRVNLFLEDRAKHPDKPFFLYFAHPAAHGPIQSRADDLAYFKEKAKTPRLIGHKSPEYAGLIKGMDRSIGAVLDKLDELDLSDNTAVILISDNGGHPGYTRNTPLRGGKSMLYEGGVRVPMIVRWPGKTKPGTVCDVTSDIADIYPTLMEIAGVDYSDFKADKTTDGESLKPLFSDLKNSKGGYGREEFYQFYGKLGYNGFHNFATWASLRKGDYKLHYDYQGKVELYNIAKDMFEKTDLVKENPTLTLELLVQLTDWLKENCNEAYLPKPNPNFNPKGKLPYGPYVPLEQLKASLLAAKAVNPAVKKYSDGRPAATFRMDAKDHGIVLRYGDGPDQCDTLGARDVWVFEDNDTYYMHYDAAGPTGWLNSLAVSKDLLAWEKKGPILDLGQPGEDDSAGACYGVTYNDGKEWHMFYLGTPNVSRPPNLIPSFPYLTMKAKGSSPSGPWIKQKNVIPFRTKPNTYYSITASPGQVIKNGDEYLQFFSATTRKPGNHCVQRTLGTARTKDLDGPWTIDPKPMVPIEEQIENSTLYYEKSNKTWFLFTNHIGIDGGEFTDAIWVYWSKDLNQWDAKNKAVVLDGQNCNWSRKCIGLPSVVQVGKRLALFYDAPEGNSTSHMKRHVGLAWLELPLRVPNE